MMEYKCRRCRCLLFKDRSLLMSHGEAVMEFMSQQETETCTKSSTVWYISTEDDCPEWVTKCLNRGEWCKGKLLCPKCRARLGSFDFTSSQRCSCSVKICPPIHVNKNRVDCFPEKVVEPCAASKITDSRRHKSAGGTISRCDSVLQKRIMNGKAVASLSTNEWVTSEGVNCKPCGDGLSLGDVHEVTDSEQNTPQASSSSHDVSERLADDGGEFELITNRSRIGSLTSDGSERSDNGHNNVSTSHTGRREISQGFVSKRKNRHKRVVSDCSFLQSRQSSDFVLNHDSRHGNAHSSDNLTSLPVNEESHPRSHGNRNVSKKWCGHRRAQSMTATTNRFEFLQEEADSVISKNLSRSTADMEEQKKLAAERVLESTDPPVPEEFICPVCLDLLCNPHSCLPCEHSFCESCLRQLARSQPEKTTCPMCRQVIVQCVPQHPLSFLLKGTYPGHFNRRRKAFKKQHGKLHPLPKLKVDLRHKLGVVMQNRLRGQRLRELCRDHFIMTFFVYTGAVIVLLGVFLLLILVCCKSLFFLFLLLQWLVFGVLRCATGAADLVLMVSPSLITTTTDAAAANRVILAVIALATVYKLWTGLWSGDRGAGRM